jgi:hypothetical protein
MTKKNLPAGKASKIIYWISTIWLALGMLSTGIVQLFKMQAEGAVAPPGVYGITLLGYPTYFLTILGVWKILGVIALLIPKFPLLKEWAYAGFFFIMSGAVFSHMALGNQMTEIFPSLLLLILTVVSWYFRPADRKIIPISRHSDPDSYRDRKSLSLNA